MGWYEDKKGLSIFGLSRDGPYSHREFAQKEDINYPLLSDTDGEVLSAYDVLIPEIEGLKNVPRRSLFLIDSDRTITFKWVAEKNFEESDFGLNPVREAIKEL